MLKEERRVEPRSGGSLDGRTLLGQAFFTICREIQRQRIVMAKAVFVAALVYCYDRSRRNEEVLLQLCGVPRP